MKDGGAWAMVVALEVVKGGQVPDVLLKTAEKNDGMDVVVEKEEKRHR